MLPRTLRSNHTVQFLVSIMTVSVPSIENNSRQIERQARFVSDDFSLLSLLVSFLSVSMGFPTQVQVLQAEGLLSNLTQSALSNQ